MNRQDRFTYKLSRASGDAFKTVVQRLYAYLEEDLEAYSDSSLRVDPSAVLDYIDRVVDTDRVEFDRAGIRSVVNKLFTNFINEIPENNDMKLDISIFMRELSSTLTGNIAFDGAPYNYGIVAPDNDDDYSKPSARMRSTDFRQKHNLSSCVVKEIGDLPRIRALVFEAPLSASEVMIAGAARERGLEMVLINYSKEELLPGVPTFQTPEEAFSDILSRCRAQGEGHEDVDVDIVKLEGIPGSHLPKEALELRLEILEQGYTQLMKSVTFSTDRAASREATLFRMIHEDRVPEDVRKSYFDIVANGSISGESPVYAQKVNSMRHAINRLEDEIDDLKVKIEELQPQEDLEI